MTNGIIIRNGVKYAGGSSSSSSDVKVADVVEKGNKNAVTSNAVATVVENVSDSLVDINTNLDNINSQITDVVDITPSTDLSTLPKGIFPIQVVNQTFGEIQQKNGSIQVQAKNIKKSLILSKNYIMKKKLKR